MEESRVRENFAYNRSTYLGILYEAAFVCAYGLHISPPAIGQPLATGPNFQPIWKVYGISYQAGNRMIYTEL